MKSHLLFISFLFSFLCLNNFPVSGQIKRAEKVYKKINDAVVRVYAYHDNNSMHGQSSGVIIKQKGWIVTNYHILGDAQRIYAEHKGKFFTLDSIVAMDPKKDILILQMAQSSDSNKHYKFVPDIRIGNSDQLRVGQKIYAIGSPYGFENTITEGIISGLRTSFDSTQNFIQISAPISSGSSGGAVVNAKGELIGISTLVISGEAAQNLNFAILVNDVLKAAQNTNKPVSETDESSANYYFQRGYNEYLSKNYLTAIINYEKALAGCTQQQDAGTVYYYMGAAYQNLGFPDSAVKYYSASAMVLQTANAYVGLGTAYFQQNNFEKSLEYYQKAIAVSPDFYEGYLGMGLVFYTQGNYSDAVSYLHKTVQLNLKTPMAYLLLGHISSAISQDDKSMYFYQQAIQWNSDYAEAYHAVANLYIKKGEIENAVPYQQKAYQLKPELRNPKK